MIRTNVRINIRIKNIRIFKYSNIFVTLCIKYNVISSNTKQYQTIPSSTIKYHAIPYTTIQYHLNPVFSPRCYIHLRWRFLKGFINEFHLNFQNCNSQRLVPGGLCLIVGQFKIMRSKV